MTANLTILIVDDHATSRLKLSMAVKQLGHSVENAADGREALDAIRARIPDLVLLDLLMPEMDGYEVLEALRGDAALKNVPVIAISSTDDEESINRALKLGARSFIAKEFGAAELQEHIDQVLGQG